MPNLKTSQFGPASTLTGSEIIGLVQSSENRRSTIEDIATYINTGGAEVSLAWDVTVTYDEDDIVEYDLRLWVSLQNANLANTPAEGAWWTEVSRGSNWEQWAAGAYSYTDVYVVREIDSIKQLFRLANATRPYVSAVFNTEWLAGDWELVSDAGYLIITKTAHGYSVGDSLVKGTGTWSKKSTEAQIPVALVKTVVDVDTLIIQLLGKLSKAYTGLTDASLYYAQSNGTLSTTLSTRLIGVAISTTDIVTISTNTPLEHFRGAFDASGGTFPTTGGNGTSGAPLAGDEWHISVGGTIAGVYVPAMSFIKAFQTSPSSDWTLTGWRLI